MNTRKKSFFGGKKCSLSGKSCQFWRKKQFIRKILPILGNLEEKAVYQENLANFGRKNTVYQENLANFGGKSSLSGKSCQFWREKQFIRKILLILEGKAVIRKILPIFGQKKCSLSGFLLPPTPCIIPCMAALNEFHKYHAS